MKSIFILLAGAMLATSAHAQTPPASTGPGSKTPANLIRIIKAENVKQVAAAKKNSEAATAMTTSLRIEDVNLEALLKTIPKKATVAQAVDIFRRVMAQSWLADDPAFAEEIRSGKHTSSFVAIIANLRTELDKDNLVL